MPYVAEVSAASLNLGSTLVGSPCSKSVVLKNMGARSFSYTITGLDAPFSTTATGGTLAAGAEDVVIPVTFAPTETGAFQDDLVITFNPESRLEPIQVHVTGKGSDAVCDGTVENEFLPIYGWCYNYKQINQMIYPASYLAAIGGKSIASITFYSTEPNLFHGGKYNVSVGLTDQATFSGSNRITGLQTVAADLVAEAGQTELTINFAQPFAYEAGKNLVVEFEVTQPGTHDEPYTERTYFYGENQSRNVSFFSWLDSNGNVIQEFITTFLPKIKIVEEGTAGNSYLNIANYATMDEAGATVGGMSTIYKYTEKNGQAWLTLSCYGAMAVDANQDWFEITSLSPYRRDWTSTDVIRGRTAYFGSNNSYILYGTGTQTFYITNCSQAKAYVQGNSYTTANATLTVYECSRNAGGTLTPATDAFDTKQGRDGIIASEVLDPTKYYKVVLTGGGDFPELLEIGFRTPLPTIALLNDDSESAQKNADIISDLAGNGKLYDVTLADRTLYKDGSWNTLCLPFSLTAEQMAANTDFADAELMTLDVTENNGFDAAGGTLYLWFKTATAIEAGVPYLVKWEKAAGYDDNPSAYDVVNPVFEGVAISSPTAQTVESATNGLETVQMVGTFSPVSVAADGQSILFLGGANTLYYPSADLQICSCRAYFSVPYFKENAGAKVYAFELNFDGEEATGILEVSADSNEKKDGAWYSLGGMRMNGKPTGRGMYINSGKKVVIK
jgi:hypothetical protein